MGAGGDGPAPGSPGVGMMSGKLEAVSNVIELKPGRKYLLVFKEIDISKAEQVLHMLDDAGIEGIGVALWADEDIEVIEIPDTAENVR